MAVLNLHHLTGLGLHLDGALEGQASARGGDPHFEGIRVVFLADGLDSADEQATLGIQILGIFNELQLQDFKKALRGQIGQKGAGLVAGRAHLRGSSGPEGSRTPDLTRARGALYQLSYRP